MNATQKTWTPVIVMYYQSLAEQLVVKDLIFVLLCKFLTQSDGLFPHLSTQRKETEVSFITPSANKSGTAVVVGIHIMKMSVSKSLWSGRKSLSQLQRTWDTRGEYKMNVTLTYSTVIMCGWRISVLMSPISSSEENKKKKTKTNNNTRIFINATER